MASTLHADCIVIVFVLQHAHRETVHVAVPGVTRMRNHSNHDVLCFSVVSTSFKLQSVTERKKCPVLITLPMR